MAERPDEGETKIDLWLKEIARRTELRKWFHAAVKDAGEFRRRYQAELKDHANSSRDRERNHAVILKEILGQPSTRRVQTL